MSEGENLILSVLFVVERENAGHVLLSLWSRGVIINKKGFSAGASLLSILLCQDEVEEEWGKHGARR